jgi:hypothetical protein
MHRCVKLPSVLYLFALKGFWFMTYYLILLYSVPMDLEIENNSTQLEYILEGGEQEFVLDTNLADEILRTNEEFPNQVPVLYTVGL